MTTSPEPQDALAALRADIDAADRELAALLARRAAVAVRIGDLKKARGLPPHAPEREARVYERVAALDAGALSGAATRPIWREIIAACRALETPFRVAYLGPEGTFSHQAAAARFGAPCDYLPRGDIVDIFHAVERGEADVGVVPIENSTEGPVTVTHDALLDFPALTIGGETSLRVHQHLAARPGQTLADLRLVLSHPQALAQCRRWLSAHAPGAAVREVASTALAAERARRETGAAALAGELAVRLHGLDILAANIEDRPDNSTRFLVVGRQAPAPTGRDRTSVVFQVRNEAGSLYAALLPFKVNGVNLSRIESRPARGNPWEYAFFVDLEGHRDDPAVAAALAGVAQAAAGYRCLGSYPRFAPEEEA